MGHDKYQGMFMGSELGFSYRCKCGWTSDRYNTDGEAMEAASQHEKGEQPVDRSWEDDAAAVARMESAVTAANALTGLVPDEALEAVWRWIDDEFPGWHGDDARWRR